MKLLPYQKEEIFNGMLEMLDPNATEQQAEMVEIAGYYLRTIHNVFKDKNGKPIVDFMKYTYPRISTVPVNHKQKMGHIIEAAADEAELTDKLGEYLAKYALSQEAVIQSIPVKHSLNKFKQNEN